MHHEKDWQHEQLSGESIEELEYYLTDDQNDIFVDVKANECFHLDASVVTMQEYQSIKGLELLDTDVVEVVALGYAFSSPSSKLDSNMGLTKHHVVVKAVSNGESAQIEISLRNDSYLFFLLWSRT